MHAALTLAAKGLAVFPLAPGGKVPLVPKSEGGRGCLDATRDEATIRAWWTRCPTANVGVATGAVSGIVVLDLDPRHGSEDTIAALRDEFGDLPPTRAVLTGGGGVHLHFRHPGSEVPNSAGRIGPGLDVRGDGGYVVAPPSVHESGRRYRWAPGTGVLAAVPDWLLPKMLPARPAPANVPSKPVEVRKFERYVRSAVAREIGRVRTTPEGSRNATLAASAWSLGTLVGAGALYESQVIDELTAAGLAIGLSPAECERTVPRQVREGAKRPRDLALVGGR